MMKNISKTPNIDKTAQKYKLNGPTLLREAKKFVDKNPVLIEKLRNV